MHNIAGAMSVGCSTPSDWFSSAFFGAKGCEIALVLYYWVGINSGDI